MNKKSLTVLLMGIVVLSTILYDIFALYQWGDDYTVSAVLNHWSFEAHPLLMYLVGSANGFLVCHFLNWRAK